jgi:hypothetical protein
LYAQLWQPPGIFWQGGFSHQILTHTAVADGSQEEDEARAHPASNIIACRSASAMLLPVMLLSYLRLRLRAASRRTLSTSL